MYRIYISVPHMSLFLSTFILYESAQANLETVPLSRHGDISVIFAFFLPFSLALNSANIASILSLYFLVLCPVVLTSLRVPLLRPYSLPLC